MNTDTVCIFSGGMDSMTLVELLHTQGRLHSALGFNYGQRHAKELEYAREHCRAANIPYHVIDLTGLTPHLLGSALTDADVSLPTKAHHEDVAQRATVVPNRNMIMLSLAIGYAVSHKLATVAFGAHGGDREVYPDCRHEFVDAINAVSQIAGWHSVRIEAPFLNIDKRGILRLGRALGVAYEYAWTCYMGGDLPCGKCGSCRERLAAFEDVGITDPAEYAGDWERYL